MGGRRVGGVVEARSVVRRRERQSRKRMRGKEGAGERGSRRKRR